MVPTRGSPQLSLKAAVDMPEPSRRDRIRGRKVRMWNLRFLEVWRDGSAVKSMCCSRSGHRFCPSDHMVDPNCLEVQFQSGPGFCSRNHRFCFRNHTADPNCLEVQFQRIDCLLICVFLSFSFLPFFFF